MARNTSGITLETRHGRTAVNYNRQTMSLHHTPKEARKAARKLHLSIFPMDSLTDLDMWYGRDSRDA